jgi:thiol-disulfide isomerase/thioredoxin
VTAIQAVKAPAQSAHLHMAGPPRISGEWIIPHASEKGEQAWRLIVKQNGATVNAAILRVDGDTGTLNGGFADGAFRLSHFAGERPALLEIRPTPDGQLKLSLTDGDGHADLTAVRPAQALAKGIAPADPTHFTGVKDPAAPFQFAFPDLAGRRVANTDARFRGKVVVVDVMGSWCPNCHDEAPFLQAMYAKHHREGLEVVALDFEQPDQLADPQRLKAFVARYGVTYTVLLAGQPKEVHDKLPQAQNLSAWPTTFFLRRDGRVDQVHVGFTSPGSGPRDAETRAAAEHEIEALLAKPRPPKA